MYTDTQRRKPLEDGAEKDSRLLSLVTRVMWPLTWECQQPQTLKETRDKFSP